MPIDFSNASLLSYNHEAQYFGDTSMRYRIVKNIEVEGYLLNLRNIVGVSGIVSGAKALSTSATDWQGFIINGVNFGTGIINSIEYEESNDVRLKKYKINLQIFDSGNINNFPTNGYFNNINYTDFYLIDNLSENVNWINTTNKKTYTHEISVKLLSNSISNSISKAKTIANNLFNTASNLTSLGGNYSYLSNYKPNYIEIYDEINGECSFTKTIDFLNTLNGDYSINKSYNFSRKEDGITTVTEHGEIRAQNQDYLTVLTNAFNSETGSAYTNCQAVYSNYSSNNEYTFSNHPIIQAVSIDKFNKSLTYDLTFTNNPNIYNGAYLEYQQVVTYEGDNIISTSEHGKIVGFGEQNSNKYNKAINLYNTSSGDIYARAKSVYDNFKTIFTLNDSNQFVLLNKKEIHSPYNGYLEYEYSYSNDTTATPNNDIRKVEITVNKQDIIKINRDITVFAYKEINQQSVSNIASEHSVSINLRGKRNTPLQTYLDYAINAIPAGVAADILTSVNYSLNPVQNSFTFNAQWAKIYEV